MFTRSDYRHSCYRMKSGKPLSPGNEEAIIDVEKVIPVGESWDTFADNWDILLDKSNQVFAVKPETDYDYVHSICLEIALSKKHNIDLNLDSRGDNVLQIVELNMMKNMEWGDYNKTWGVFIDYDLKKIHTKLFKTQQNIVTPEMIAASRESDGSAMVSQGSIPVIQLSDAQPFEPTEAEREIIKAALKKKKH